MSFFTRRRHHLLEAVTCSEVARTLQIFLDGETDDLSRQRVSRHLAACRRCGMEIAIYRELKRLLRAGTEPPAGAILRLRAFTETLANA